MCCGRVLILRRGGEQLVYYFDGVSVLISALDMSRLTVSTAVHGVGGLSI